MSAPASAVAHVGRKTQSGLSHLGALILFTATGFARALRRPRRRGAFALQLVQIGVRSLPLSITTAAFAGMVMALQFGYGLDRFGARLYIGQTTVYGLVRELSPILTALVVGGRVGSGVAAELSGMAVTEQIDAVRALGADPMQRLVAPRLVAVIISMPVLTVLADVVGFFGGMLVASLQYDISPRLYARGVFDFVGISDFGSGLFKTVVFSLIIGGVACYEGVTAVGGTVGVGRATSRAVVVSSLSILAADVLLTRLLMST